MRSCVKTDPDSLGAPTSGCDCGGPLARARRSETVEQWVTGPTLGPHLMGKLTWALWPSYGRIRRGPATNHVTSNVHLLCGWPTTRPVRLLCG